MYRNEETTWKIRESAAYKFLTKGKKYVSDLKLVATLTGSARVARELFQHYAFSAMAKASIAELMNIQGVGQKTAMRVVATFEIARRRDQEDNACTQFINSAAVAEYIQPKYKDHGHEVFCVLFLNWNLRLIAEEEVFIGGISTCIVDPRIIFKKAVNYLASSLVLLHNHPSGNLNPSRADKKITKKMVKGAKLLGIKILDHIIVSGDGYFSFADEGMI